MEISVVSRKLRKELHLQSDQTYSKYIYLEGMRRNPAVTFECNSTVNRSNIEWITIEQWSTSNFFYSPIYAFGNFMRHCQNSRKFLTFGKPGKLYVIRKHLPNSIKMLFLLNLKHSIESYGNSIEI